MTSSKLKSHSKHSGAPSSLSLHHFCPFITDRKKKKLMRERKCFLPEVSVLSRVWLGLCRRKRMDTLHGPGGRSRETRAHLGYGEARLPKWRPRWGLPGGPREGEAKLGSCNQSRWGGAFPENGHQPQGWDLHAAVLTATEAPSPSHYLTPGNKSGFLLECWTFLSKYQCSFVHPTHIYLVFTRCLVLCWDQRWSNEWKCLVHITLICILDGNTGVCCVINTSWTRKRLT